MNAHLSPYEFVRAHVSPFATAIPPGGWPSLWETLQCRRLNRYLALVYFDTAANHGPIVAMHLLQRAAGVDERYVHMTNEEWTPIVTADPFRLASALIEHRRATLAWTGNAHGHLDRLTRIVRDGYTAAGPHRRKAAERAAKRREASVPPSLPNEDHGRGVALPLIVCVWVLFILAIAAAL